jgi:hypothetical protein
MCSYTGSEISEASKSGPGGWPEVLAAVRKVVLESEKILAKQAIQDDKMFMESL